MESSRTPKALVPDALVSEVYVAIGQCLCTCYVCVCVHTYVHLRMLYSRVCELTVGFVSSLSRWGGGGGTI